MKNKRRSIIAVIAVIAIILGIIAGIYVVNNSKEQSKIAQSDITNQDKEKSIDTLTDVEKEIAGIGSDSQKDDEKNYSELYKEYLAESGVVLKEKVPYDFKEYSEEEYEKFPDMEKVIEVTETVDFPSIYKNTYGEQYTEEQLKEFRDAVKKHIMQNGGKSRSNDCWMG